MKKERLDYLLTQHCPADSAHVASLTITLQLLLEYAMHELAAHVAEGGAKEHVVLEAMRHIHLESLLQVL
jgi:hypothetical protein